MNQLIRGARRQASLLSGLLALMAPAVSSAQDLVITGVIDGPLAGGVPKAVELRATQNIGNLSLYGLGSANNGAGSNGQEYTFPAVPVAAGEFLYLATENNGFQSFFGFAPDYTSGAVSINGDDAIELFMNGAVVDVFGNINQDGTGQPWDYEDGWAKRRAGGPDGSTFVIGNWSFSGPNALDNETSNATADVPFPVGDVGGGECDGAVPIADVQGNGAETPLAGSAVTVQGTVTAVFGSELVVQDPAGGVRSGIVVFSPGSSVSRGDRVCVSGIANERFEQTQIGGNSYPAATVELLGAGTLPAPMVVASADLGAAASAEPLEGVLVRVEAVTVTDADLGNGEWSVDDGSGAARVDDVGSYTYAPSAGDALDFVQGPLFFTFSQYKIEPRDDADISAAPADPCASAGKTRISAIQGPGAASPLDGQVHSIKGVVVGDFQGDARLQGFFVQEEDADRDGDPNTSEGVFVFQGNNPADVAVGDVVAVTGTVDEFFELTELTNVSSLTVCSSGAAVTPASISLPVASVADLERYEGMDVLFPGKLFVTETFNMYEFGEVALATHVLKTPTQVANPGPDAAALQSLNDRSRVLVDDGFDSDRYNDCTDDIATTYLPGAYLSSPPATLRVGDQVEALRGALTFSFSAYRVLPGTDPICSPDFFTRTAQSARPTAAPEVGGDLTVASFNVLNYFLTIDNGSNGARGADSAAELERQKQKIVAAIQDLDADIVGLIELENSASDAPIADLAAATGHDYVSTGLIGTDAITVGFLFDPNTVVPVGEPAILDSSVDPSYDSDLNRPALLQTFEQISSGERVNVVVNHFKSKGSACTGDPDTGDGQGNCNQTRLAAARALANWLASDPTGQGDPDHLIIGDLNAYGREDPIRAILDAGYRDLVAELGGDGDSYVFTGQSGRLDHGLASASLRAQVTGAAVWQINAQEPRILDYNDAIVDPAETIPVDDPNPIGLYVGDEFRSSDHNPVRIGLDLESNPGRPACRGLAATIVGTSGNDVLTGTPGQNVIVARAGNDVIRGR